MKKCKLNRDLVLLFGSLLLSVIVTLPGEARPEYALKYNMNRCTGCHLSPGGGGLKNVNGKQYGAHGFKSGKWSTREEFALDMRALFFQPESPSSESGGLGLMAVNAGVNLEVTPGDVEEAEIRLVLNQMVGGFGQSTRDSYLRARFYEDTETNWYPQYVLVGQFHAPFGLITDEHETFTKIQSQSTWNNFEMGVLFSGNPLDQIHWDLSYVNGERGGGGRADGRALLWGSTANVRWQPKTLPLMSGVSYSVHDRKDEEISPWAGSVYTMVNLSPITRYLFNGTLSFEYVEAKYWNSTLIGYINDSDYADSLANTTSSGMLTKLEWNISQRWSTSYQFEELALNRDYKSDAYSRHSYGVKYWAAANTSILARWMQSSAGHPLEESSTKRWNRDSFFVVLQSGI